MCVRVCKEEREVTKAVNQAIGTGRPVCVCVSVCVCVFCVCVYVCLCVYVCV